MVDPLHSLFDDGALVEVDSDEVGRRANELDPAGMGLAERSDGSGRNMNNTPNHT